MWGEDESEVGLSPRRYRLALRCGYRFTTHEQTSGICRRVNSRSFHISDVNRSSISVVYRCRGRQSIATHIEATRLGKHNIQRAVGCKLQFGNHVRHVTRSRNVKRISIIKLINRYGILAIGIGCGRINNIATGQFHRHTSQSAMGRL